MKSINEQSLSLELDNFKAPHDSSSITTIIIRTIEARESLSMYLEQYLESQPWWRFQQWLKIEQEEIIVLERAPPSYESDMRDLIQSNYIPEHQCHSKFLDALYVSSDTWGNRLLLLQGWVDKADSNSVQGVISLGRSNYVEAHECSMVNRWNCLFLRSTNCTISKVALSNTANKNSYYYPATESSTLASTEPPKGTRTSHGNIPFQIYNLDINKGQVSASSPQILVHDANAILRTYGILTRFNINFSQQVQKNINDFRLSFSPPFNPNVSCIAIHIRRNDRSIKGMNGSQISEFCRSRSKYDEKSKELVVDLSKEWHDKSSKTISHGTWMNLGCRLKLPYGSATFDHFFNASLILDPSIKNIFVMTDDRVALANDVSLLTGKTVDGDAASHLHFQHRGVNVYNYAASAKHRDRTMQSSAEFWSSIRIAQQCKGLVAYYESSAAAKIINMNMCSYHDNKYKSCPLLFNFAVKKD